MTDIDTARALRDEGMAHAEEGAGEDWGTRALEGVRRLCRERREWLCDDVWNYVDAPDNRRALGPVLLKAERAGWCEKTGDYRPSSQPQCHANPRAVRRSLIFAESTSPIP